MSLSADISIIDQIKRELAAARSSPTQATGLCFQFEDWDDIIGAWEASESMRQSMERVFALVADALGGNIKPGDVDALSDRIAQLRDVERRLEKQR